MGMFQSTKWVLSITVLLIMIVSCATVEHHYAQGVDDSGKPQWVVLGTHTLKSKNGRSFFGVGAAPTTGEFSRQASAANLRAKDELEQMVERFIEVVSRDYIASGSATPSGYLVSEAPRQIFEMTNLVVPNAQVKEHWIDSKNNQIFAIAEIDYYQLVSALDASTKVNPGFKNYLKGRGEQVFDRIARQY